VETQCPETREIWDLPSSIESVEKLAGGSSSLDSSGAADHPTQIGSSGKKRTPNSASLAQVELVTLEASWVPLTYIKQHDPYRLIEFFEGKFGLSQYKNQEL